MVVLLYREVYFIKIKILKNQTKTEENFSELIYLSSENSIETKERKGNLKVAKGNILSSGKFSYLYNDINQII